MLCPSTSRPASRASAGLAPLKVDSGLQAHARKHTGDMIAADAIFHSTATELANNPKVREIYLGEKFSL